MCGSLIDSRIVCKEVNRIDGPLFWVLCVVFLVVVVGGGLSSMKDVYEGGGIIGLIAVVGLIMALAAEGL